MSSGADRDRWGRLQELFEAALEVAPDERAAYLATIADTALRAEVRSLLASHEDEGRLDALASAITAATEGGEAISSPVEAPARVGPYEVSEPLGSGGMGSVYRARRADGTDPVALKVLRADVDTDRIRRRFLAERDILTRIDHPNIARVLDDGFTEEGLPYFVMELVEGSPIDVYCDDARLAVAARLALFAVVCDAVDHAHALGVVHRDIKPQNVLVTVNGDVRLLDFGIAKILDQETFPGLGRHTTTGVHLLTPEFASPEQLFGAPITPASDLYQLGLLLYQLLVGVLPPVGARLVGRMPEGASRRSPLRSPSQALAAPRDPRSRAPAADVVAEARSTTASQLVERLTGDIDAIVLHALGEHPEDRPGSAAALAAEVRAHLAAPPAQVGMRVTRLVPPWPRAWPPAARAAASLLIVAIGVLAALRLVAR